MGRGCEVSTNDGGPAFPALVSGTNENGGVVSFTCTPGMSLRDWFIGQAIVAIYQTDRTKFTYAEDAEDAVRLADAMLVARNTHT